MKETNETRYMNDGSPVEIAISTLALNKTVVMTCQCRDFPTGL